MLQTSLQLPPVKSPGLIQSRIRRQTHDRSKIPPSSSSQSNRFQQYMQQLIVTSTLPSLLSPCVSLLSLRSGTNFETLLPSSRNQLIPCRQPVESHFPATPTQPAIPPSLLASQPLALTQSWSSVTPLTLAQPVASIQN